MDRVRTALLGWMRGVMAERGWTAGAWARQAEVTPTNLTRFLKDPENASLPSADTIGRLCLAAESEPRFLDTVRPADLPRARVPILMPRQVRALQAMSDADALTYLERLTRDGIAALPAAPGCTPASFAVRVTSLHMNAGGWLPDDHVILEPPSLRPPRNGDFVLVLEGDHACGYRLYPPLLVPASTDSSCCPLRLEEAAIAGVAVQLVRAFRAA